MKQRSILHIFFVVIGIALFLRIFVLDIVFISNDDLEPQFLAGDAILVSKLSPLHSGGWILLENPESSGNYSMRRLVQEIAPGEWSFSTGSQENKEWPIVQTQKILGRAVMILWSRRCSSSTESCGKRSSKYLAVIN